MMMILQDNETYDIAHNLVRKSCTGISADVLEILKERIDMEETASARNMLQPAPGITEEKNNPEAGFTTPLRIFFNFSLVLFP